MNEIDYFLPGRVVVVFEMEVRVTWSGLLLRRSGAPKNLSPILGTSPYLSSFLFAILQNSTQRQCQQRLKQPKPTFLSKGYVSYIIANKSLLFVRKQFQVASTVS